MSLDDKIQHQSLDDEKTNRTFSFFLICIIASTAIGFVFGVVVTLGIICK
jgi:hypothetical protein